MAAGVEAAAGAVVVVVVVSVLVVVRLDSLLSTGLEKWEMGLGLKFVAAPKNTPFWRWGKCCDFD